MAFSISERIKKLRNCNEYKKWKNAIIKRDKNQCILCKSSKNIEIDHIKSLALFPELALDINNGRILCKDCHKKTDTYGSLSRFKGEERLHPILMGDLAHQIQQLPCSITIQGKNIGLEIKYEANAKIWIISVYHTLNIGLLVGLLLYLIYNMPTFIVLKFLVIV